MGTTTLRIALPKGRLYDLTTGIIARARIPFSAPPADSRKLVFEQGELVAYLVKPGDIPFLVQHGAADVGFVGLDALLETRADVLDVLDLRLGKCRMVLASVQGTPPFNPRLEPVLRVATQYPQITTTHFRMKGQSVQVIALTGSVEIAPLSGLASRIVDLVETGKTLADNKLVEEEVLFTSTCRLVCNRASYMLRSAQIGPFIEKLRATTHDSAAEPR